MNYRDQKRQPINIGDTVAYSLQFLDSTGLTHSAFGHARGSVTFISEQGLATLLWDDPDLPPRVNVVNLAKAGERGRFYRD